MKLFFIGFNKTGTTTYHSLFRHIIRSVHDSRWVSMANAHNTKYLSKFDCFSDGECVDFEFLDKRYPKSKFILNTRRLRDWIWSRIKHIYRNYPQPANGNMAKQWNTTSNKVDVIVDWIKKRDRYHKKCVEYFKNKENFLILNICDPESIQKLEKFTGMKLPKDNIPKNVRKQIKCKDEKYWNGVILQAFKRAGIKEIDSNTDLLTL